MCSQWGLESVVYGYMMLCVNISIWLKLGDRTQGKSYGG